MAYLRLQDYLKFIAESQLDEVTDKNPFYRLLVEPTAEEEAKSKLVQKYDVNREFAGISVYDTTKTYKALSNVYLEALDYSNTANYTANQSQVTGSDGNVYVCLINNGPLSTVRNPVGDVSGSWLKLGAKYDFFNGIVPNPEWDWTKKYKVSQTIWYKDKNYTSLRENYNTAPDSEDGAIYWGTGTSYSIASNSLQDPTKWQTGDLRCQRLVECVVMLCLEKMYKRTAARQVPQWIADSYNQSMSWLADASQGITVTAPLKELPQRSGHRIRITGNPKNVNMY